MLVVFVPSVLSHRSSLSIFAGVAVMANASGVASRKNTGAPDTSFTYVSRMSIVNILRLSVKLCLLVQSSTICCYHGRCLCKHTQCMYWTQPRAPLRAHMVLCAHADQEDRIHQYCK